MKEISLMNLLKMILKHDKIRKIATVQSDDYTAGCSQLNKLNLAPELAGKAT